MNSNGATYTTLSDITSMLSGIIATMTENERRIVRINTGTDTSLTPFNPWNDYIGWIAKTNLSGTYWHSHFVGRDGSDVEIGCNNGTISARSLSSNLKSCFVCVRKHMVISSDGLTAGAYGFYTGSITVPTGYRTTGMHSISLGHPGVGGGLSLMCGVGRGLSGTLTIYVGYYTPRAIAGSNSDFELTLECIKDEYYTPIVSG